MKAKLIKLENGEYDLLVDTNVKNLAGTKLSLTNCQAIERGYDLDELAEEVYSILNLGINSTTEIHTLHQQSFKEGFQKALELMSDKKFSEQDVKNIFAKTLENAPSMESHTRMISDEQYRHSVMDELYDKITKSLQQTEWDVEIETIEYGLGNDKDGRPVYETRCLLDADGCLILKRI